MNLNKKNTNHTVIFVSLFCIVYILISARSSRKELHFQPEWTEDISRTKPCDENEKLIPFKLAQNYGYFTADGKIISNKAYPFKASISEKWNAAYTPDSTSVDFFNADGTKAGTIKECGFPFFDQDRIFVFQPGGNAFIKCSETGDRLWSFEYYAPITAFSSCGEGTVAGFSDGTLFSFSKDGKIDQRFSPGGSDISIILGAGISEDGKRIACISGRKQQRFVVSEKNNGHSKIIFHEYLDGEINRQTLVKFNKSADIVYYDCKDSLGIVDLRKSTSKKIPLSGKISQIEFSDDEKLVFILSKEDGKYTVTVLEDYFHLLSEFSFEGYSAFIQTEDNSLFVGHNNKISRMTISRK